MKIKDYFVLAIIIVLLGAYLLVRNGSQIQYELPVLETADQNNITRIEIKTSGADIAVFQRDAHWEIGDAAYPADTNQVNDMLSVLEKLTLTALVSETEAYSRYNLADDQKIAVQAWTGDRMVRDLVIGKTADTYQHTFVRIGEDPNIYHANGNFRQTFDQSVENLRDKTAVSFSIDDITGVEIDFAEKHLSLALKDEPPADIDSVSSDPESEASIWINEADGTPADTETIQRLLSQLAYLNCSGYLEGKTKEDFNTPVSTIRLVGKGPITLSLFEKIGSETECPAFSSQNDYPFTLDETACTRLSEALEKLFDSGTEG